MRPRILLVEDDEKLGAQIAGQLAEAGYEPRWVRRGDEALALLPGVFELVILDLMLPGAYGLDVLKHLRRDSDVPLLVLSAKSDAGIKVRALELGADDYLTKPFWPEELLARVQARMRRPAMSTNGRIELGELVLDLGARRALVAGADVALTGAEFEILHALARRPGAAVARSWIVEHVLDPRREGSERTLDVHISRLRKKLGPCGSSIATVWGLGYRLEAPRAR